MSKEGRRLSVAAAVLATTIGFTGCSASNKEVSSRKPETSTTQTQSSQPSRGAEQYFSPTPKETVIFGNPFPVREVVPDGKKPNAYVPKGENCSVGFGVAAQVRGYQKGLGEYLLSINHDNPMGTSVSCKAGTMVTINEQYLPPAVS